MNGITTQDDYWKQIRNLDQSRKSLWTLQSSKAAIDTNSYVETYMPPTITCCKCQAMFAVGVKHYCTEDCQ